MRGFDIDNFSLLVSSIAAIAGEHQSFSMLPQDRRAINRGCLLFTTRRKRRNHQSECGGTGPHPAHAATENTHACCDDDASATIVSRTL